MDGLPTEINIITLNCWGLKYISKLRNQRITEIGRKLASADPPPHIVGLQECFTQEDYESVRRETRYILPYGKFYYGGTFGGGLVILSKWPIEESTMFRYPLNGRPTAFFRGDWFVGKGVACAKIRYGPGHKDVVEVFNTHVSNTKHYVSSPIFLQPTAPSNESCRRIPLMRRGPTTHTSATAQHRPGRWPNCYAALSSGAI